MALATIIYNSGGSDTAASGSNAPTTALTDVSTSQTISTATGNTQTFSAAVNLTGVANDGSDVIWINTAAGDRHLFRITSFTGGVSTCTAVVTAELASATLGTLAWAIGGKRASFINDTTNPDFEDGVGGWTFEFEGTGTVYSAVGANPINLTDGGNAVGIAPMTIQAASGATPIIDWTDGLHLFDQSTGGPDTDFIGMTIRNNTNTTGGARMFEGNSYGALRMADCTLSCYGDIIQQGNGRLVLLNCDMNSTVGVVVVFSATRYQAHIQKCILRGSSGNGISTGTNDQQCGLTIVSCIFRDLGKNGIALNANNKHFLVSILNNVFENCTEDGVTITGTTNVDNGPIVIVNNIFTNNGQYGIASDAADITAAMRGITEDYNAFYNNTSGRVFQITEGANDVTLTADPYTSLAGDDYTLNSTAGGGAACKDVGYGYNG